MNIIIIASILRTYYVSRAVEEKVCGTEFRVVNSVFISYDCGSY